MTKNDGGFTLLEVLVALCLIATTSLLAMSAISLTIAAVTTVRSTEANIAAVNMVDHIVRDAAGQIASVGSHQYISGSDRDISLTTYPKPPIAFTGPVLLRIENDAEGRIVASWRSIAGAGQMISHALVKDARIGFLYLDDNETWSSNWSSAKPPIAVRVTLAGHSTDSFEFTVPIRVVHPLRCIFEQGCEARP